MTTSIPKTSAEEHEASKLENKKNQAYSSPEISEPKQKSNEVNENNEETKLSSKRRKKVYNPFGAAIPRARSLAHWEDPMYSGGFLGVGLAIIIFTSQFSLFNTFCALAVFSLFVNWLYVIGRKQLMVLLNREDANPYEHYFVEKPWYIERATVERYLDVVVDGSNFILQESQKIVLVDDPMRTLKYVILFYVAWTIGGWFHFRTLTTIALVLGFTIPPAYQRNKELVDQKLKIARDISNSYYESGTKILKHHTKGVVEKGKSLAAKSFPPVSKEE